MTNLEELRQLRERVAELEKRLAATTERDVDWDELPPDHPITIASLDELDIARVPGFIRHLLDKMSVQIFLKDAEFVPERGRRYRYLNLSARQPLGWKAADVANFYDRQAFNGEMAIKQWQAMVDNENQTLAARAVRRRRVSWSPALDSWRVNKTIEIPIYLRGNEASAVAFCAIADQESFVQEREGRLIFAAIFAHEIRNMATRIVAEMPKLDDYPWPSSMKDVVKELQYKLAQAEYQATLSTEMSEAILTAQQPIENEGMLPIGNHIDYFRRLYKRLPVQFEVMCTPEVAAIRAGNASVTRAILHELVRNAEKHTPYSYKRSKCIIRISVAVEDNSVIWIVSNKRDELKGRLNIPDHRADPDAALKPNKSLRLGGLILGWLIAHRLRASSKDILFFPDRSDQSGWINVSARIPLENRL